MSVWKSLTIWPHQWMYLGAYCTLMFVLFAFTGPYSTVAAISLAFTGLFVADLLVKTHDVFLNTRRTITDAHKLAVMVTGCDTGFGLYFSQRLAGMGFLVYATVLFPDGKGAQKLRQNNNIDVVKLDVTKQDNIDSVVQYVTADVQKKERTFWCLVNNAGIAFYADIEVAPMDHYQKVLDVNTFGPVRMCKAFLPLLRSGRRGRIVNITSQSGRFTLPFTTAYSMSKHALVAFSDGLRCELRPWNISVHTIQPAFYQTLDSFEDQVELILSNYWEMWEGAPDDVKKAIGIEFRDARVNALKEVCYNYCQRIEYIHEVVDELADAVAGVDPKVCYTPRLITKIGQRLLKYMPFELSDLAISPKINAVPAELKSLSKDDSSIPAYKQLLSSAWDYAKPVAKFMVPSTGTILNKTAN